MRELGLLMIGVMTLACAGDTRRDRASTNLLKNGSFELGTEPWFDFRSPAKPFWGTFTLSDAIAWKGHHSLRLALDSRNFPGGVGIAGAAQDVASAAIPRRLSGRYRVDDWQRGTRAQYVQVVVMVFRPANFPEMGRMSLQLALVLAGIERPPFEIANRRFELAGPVEPERGAWIPFDFDLHEIFARQWQRVPEGASGLRVFVEARFDGYDRRLDGRVRADVYFDDLYLGD